MSRRTMRSSPSIVKLHGSGKNSGVGCTSGMDRNGCLPRRLQKVLKGVDEPRLFLGCGKEGKVLNQGNPDRHSARWDLKIGRHPGLYPLSVPGQADVNDL